MKEAGIAAHSRLVDVPGVAMRTVRRFGQGAFEPWYGCSVLLRRLFFYEQISLISTGASNWFLSLMRNIFQTATGSRTLTPDNQSAGRYLNLGARN